MWEILQNPAVYAALSGLAAALGWENANKFFDHMVGAVGAVSGAIGIVLGVLGELKAKRAAKSKLHSS